MPSEGFGSFLATLRALLAEGADFVLIGGLALQIRGGDHVTQDIDFAFIRRRKNARRIARALAIYRPRPANHPADLPFVWDEQTLLSVTVLTLNSDLGRIDFLAEPDGAPP